MDNKDLFDQYYYFNTESPSGISYGYDNNRGCNPHKSGDPAGKHSSGTGIWTIDTKKVIDGEKVRLYWCIPRIIYEHYNNVDLNSYENIGYRDGDKKNVHPDNLYIVQRTVENRTECDENGDGGKIRLSRRFTFTFNSDEEANAFRKRYTEFMNNEIELLNSK